jgi:hypothetical protein
VRGFPELVAGLAVKLRRYQSRRSRQSVQPFGDLFASVAILEAAVDLRQPRNFSISNYKFNFLA